MEDDLTHKLRALELQLETLDLKIVETLKNASKAAANGVSNAGKAVVKGITDAGNAAWREKQIRDREQNIKNQLEGLAKDIHVIVTNEASFNTRLHAIEQDVERLEEIIHPHPVPQ